MPIYLACPNQDVTIKQVAGTDKIKTHLANLGFLIGEQIRLINRVDENVIIKLKGVSIAISFELAKRILV